MNTNTPDIRSEAKSLYWRAFSISQIANAVGVSINTLYSWRRRDKWDEATVKQRVCERTHVQYLRLIEKENPTPHDFKRIDLLGRQLDRFFRHEHKDEEKEKKKKTIKNHFTPEQIEQLRKILYESWYEHQRRWYKQRSRRNRFILKSRQIGGTRYVAQEKLLRALEDGVNQIFLSASRAQAFQFKRFIQAAAKLVGVELVGGDTIELSNGAILYFLGTSAAHAQSYTGDLNFDEVFWVSNFLNVRRVAAGMASHSHLTRTYLSTCSSEEHEAFKFWSGDLFNEERPKAEQIEIDTSHKALKNGKLCGDNVWRQIVTIEDAIKLGFDKISIEQIQFENSPDDYGNLYMCQFSSSKKRVFDYNALINCGVDGYNDDVWPDWRPFSPRPLGNRPVWVSYDPNGSSGKGDSGGLVVIAPPSVPGGKFRTVERIQLRGMEFEAQAKVIEEVTERYNVQHIAIDGTGIGAAVYQIVIKFFPTAVMYNYNPTLKRAMVLKMLMTIRAGRWEYDAGMMNLAQSFMTVRKIVTPGGITTYESDRSRGSNHGDLAWATMQCIYNEPIGVEITDTSNSFVEEF
ncbi:terminase large subunit domain-containing protein [Limnobaculum xujianqingii]|uniref:terminase large subunit domain-containing protein n=1 Tax=Limnobaculum xujianqingii TaxID=2738837 RepID=UPI001128B74D|nr:terminase family protein [Limnobaculum xujianqingii]